MKTEIARSASAGACESFQYRKYFPYNTLKCVGAAAYRSRSARDYACLLDLDPAVVSWECVTRPLTDRYSNRNCNGDFVANISEELHLVDVWDSDPGDTWWNADVARQFGYRYRAVLMPEIRKLPRFQNAKDLIRYAGYDAPLGDRIRLLAALDEFGSLTLAECLAALRDGRPMQTMAAMILKGYVEVDLDDALLGPETVVRRPSR